MTAPAPAADPQLSTAERLALLLVAYQQSTQALRDQLAGFITTLWRSLGFYGNAQQAEFVGRVVPVVLGAQQHMAALTSAHIAQQTSIAAGVPFEPFGLDPAKVSGAAVRNGTSPDEVYARPFNLVWRQLGDAQQQRDEHYNWTPPTNSHTPPAETDLVHVTNPTEARLLLPSPADYVHATDLTEPRRPSLPPADYVDKAIQSGEDRAVQTGLTDLQLAKTHAAAQTMAADPHIIGWRRALEGAYSCGLCIVASTQLYSKGKRERPKLMPIHPGCVIEGTRVSASGVKAVTRRRYAGKVTVIATAAGDELTVTPNHPVLTDKGWIPAHLVREGDRIVRGVSGKRMSGRGPDEQHGPSPIEDVWRAVSVAPLVRVPVAAEDFHGDGTDGEVDVVYVDRGLHPVGDVPGIQFAGEPQLVTGHDARDAFQRLSLRASLLPSGLSAPGGGVRGKSLSSALLGGHLACSHHSGLGPTADLHSVGGQGSPDHGAAYAVALAQFVLTGAGQVGVDYFGGGQLSPRNTSTVGLRFDPAGVEFSGDGALTYARLGRALLDRLSGEIELDSVVEARSVDYSGHVYNLQTGEGWYLANGSIVSNCDCSVQPVYENEDPAQALNEHLLGDVHAAIADRFGRSASDARALRGTDDGKGAPLLYKDLIVSHDHGELGPVLGVRGRPWTGPNDLNK